MMCGKDSQNLIREIDGGAVIVTKGLVRVEQQLKTNLFPTHDVVKILLLFDNPKTAQVKDIQYNVWKR